MTNKIDYTDPETFLDARANITEDHRIKYRVNGAPGDEVIETGVYWGDGCWSTLTGVGLFVTGWTIYGNGLALYELIEVIEPPKPDIEPYKGMVVTSLDGVEAYLYWPLNDMDVIPWGEIGALADGWMGTPEINQMVKGGTHYVFSPDVNDA